MSNTIRIKRGKSSNLSVNKLQDGELAVTLDTNKLYTNKGQISPDNVYVGDTEPTDPNVECWISPSGKIDLSSLWDQIYPVGSIYTSINATNPSTLFGGVWEQIASGRTLVGVDTSQTEFNTVKKTGGEKTHRLTESEMPVHNHSGTVYSMSQGNISATAARLTYKDGSTTDWVSEGLTWLDQSGGGQAHNNLQPYFTCYFWLRTQ